MFVLYIGHGNHTPCCSRMNIPDVCLKMCSGNVVESWDLVICMPYMSIIGACVEEGSGMYGDNVW